MASSSVHLSERYDQAAHLRGRGIFHDNAQRRDSSLRLYELMKREAQLQVSVILTFFEIEIDPARGLPQNFPRFILFYRCNLNRAFADRAGLLKAKIANINQSEEA